MQGPDPKCRRFGILWHFMSFYGILAFLPKSLIRNQIRFFLFYPIFSDFQTFTDFQTFRFHNSNSPPPPPPIWISFFYHWMCIYIFYCFYLRCGRPLLEDRAIGTEAVVAGRMNWSQIQTNKLDLVGSTVRSDEAVLGQQKHNKGFNTLHWFIKENEI